MHGRHFYSTFQGRKTRERLQWVGLIFREPVGRFYTQYQPHTHSPVDDVKGGMFLLYTAMVLSLLSIVCSHDQDSEKTSSQSLTGLGHLRSCVHVSLLLCNALTLWLGSGEASSVVTIVLSCVLLLAACKTQIITFQSACLTCWLLKLAATNSTNQKAMALALYINNSNIYSLQRRISSLSALSQLCYSVRTITLSRCVLKLSTYFTHSVGTEGRPTGGCMRKVRSSIDLTSELNVMD